MNISRRTFLIMACTIPVAPFISHQTLAAFPPLPERSAPAKARHYKSNVRRVKHPKYKKGQTCSNCQFFKFLDSGCQLFPSNSVAPTGWCQSWVLKP